VESSRDEDGRQFLCTAVHEAGHATALIALRMGLTRVSAKPEPRTAHGRRLGACTATLPPVLGAAALEVPPPSARQRRALERHGLSWLVSVLAGVAAEQRVFPGAAWVHEHALSDYAQADPLAACWVDESADHDQAAAARAVVLCAGLACAAALLDRAWPATIEITRALLRLRAQGRNPVISGRAARRLAREAGLDARAFSAVDLAYEFTRTLMQVRACGHPALAEVRAHLAIFAGLAWSTGAEPPAAAVFVDRRGSP
jgi:hypothetical protein